MTQMSRILVLDGSAAGDAAFGLAACVQQTDGGGFQQISCQQAAGKQAAEGIGLLAAQALKDAGWQAGSPIQPELVAVVVGPGSFTGLRASCATAAGYALGLGVPVVGVTRGEALCPVLDAECAQHGGDALQGWMLVTAARRGRVFVETKAGIQAVALDAWQFPAGRWLVAGDAAESVTRTDCVVSSTNIPDPAQIAAAACARLQGVLPPRDALPLYVDPPEAKLPAAGLRSAPV